MLVYENELLLNRIIITAKAASDAVVLMLGANNDLIRASAITKDIDVVYNRDWALGISSSIKKSITYLQSNYPDAEGVLFMVCDQPFVTAETIKEMINRSGDTQKSIIACSYNNTLGVPALFKKKHFAALLKLNGQQGAKTLLAKYGDDVHAIPFPLGDIDIDTPEDFNRLSHESFKIRFDI